MFYTGHTNPKVQIAATGIKGRAKHKRVFDYPMLAHIWAQQSQEDGRSPKGQMYFIGDTIYSYGRHFPIARFARPDVVLFNPEKRSNTTSTHQGCVDNAMRGLPAVRVFRVPHVDADSDYSHSKNAKHLHEQLAAHAARMAKPHVKAYWGWNDDVRIEDSETLRVESLAPYVSELLAYCETFAIDCPSFDVDAMTKKIRDAYTRYNDPKRVAKREVSIAARGERHWKTAQHVAAFFEGVTDKKPNLHFFPYRAKEDVAAQFGLSSWNLENRIEAIARRNEAAKRGKLRKEVSPLDWQNGKGGISALGHSHGATLVRRVGDTLETSRGADCPFAHAVAAFLKAQDCRAKGTTWHRNGQQIRVGHFNVDSIDTDGNLQAGCHSIEFAEMERLALREVPHLVKARFAVPAVLSL